MVKLIPLLCSWMVPMQARWSLLIPMKVKATSTGHLSIILSIISIISFSDNVDHIMYMSAYFVLTK